MESERMHRAVARIETALARIEQAAARQAGANNAVDAPEDVNLRNKVKSALAELDTLIARLER